MASGAVPKRQAQLFYEPKPARRSKDLLSLPEPKPENKLQSEISEGDKDKMDQLLEENQILKTRIEELRDPSLTWDAAVVEEEKENHEGTSSEVNKEQSRNNDDDGEKRENNEQTVEKENPEGTSPEVNKEQSRNNDDDDGEKRENNEQTVEKENQEGTKEQSSNNDDGEKRENNGAASEVAITIEEEGENVFKTTKTIMSRFNHVIKQWPTRDIVLFIIMMTTWLIIICVSGVWSESLADTDNQEELNNLEDIVNDQSDLAKIADGNFFL